jgi:hypothetical protein
MIDEESAPLYPVIGFTIGVIDGVVAFRIEYAGTKAQYEAQAGEAQQFVMAPGAAVELGQALLERGELARGASRA